MSEERSGFETSEGFLSLTGVGGTITTAMASSDRLVQIAALAALALIVWAFAWSRSKVKTECQVATPMSPPKK